VFLCVPARRAAAAADDDADLHVVRYGTTTHHLHTHKSAEEMIPSTIRADNFSLIGGNLVLLQLPFAATFPYTRSIGIGDGDVEPTCPPPNFGENIYRAIIV